MRNGEIDEVLKKAAGRAPEIEASLLRRVADSIQPSMRRVRPLPRTWMLAGGVVLICGALALVGAARAGFSGFEKMDLLERLHCPNFQAIHILVWHTAVLVVSGGLGALVGRALQFRTRD